MIRIKISNLNSDEFFTRKGLLKSSSWPSTSKLGHLPLFVVPQRMLLKLRKDNSNFLPARSSLCFVGISRNILNSYVLYLLITTILRFANVRKHDRYIFTCKWIHNARCTSKSTCTFNHRLIVVLCLKSYTKLCD